MNSEAIAVILMGAGAWIVSGLITYGFMKAKMLEFERRLDDLTMTTKLMLPRLEYDSRHGDLLRQLDRIEAKVDSVKSK